LQGEVQVLRQVFRKVAELRDHLLCSRIVHLGQKAYNKRLFPNERDRKIE
jgi:hypothetical protein